MYETYHMESAHHLYKHRIIQLKNSQLMIEPCIQICYILNGSCTIQFQQSRQQLGINDIFFFPANSPFTLVAETETISFYQILIQHEFFADSAPKSLNMTFDHFYIRHNKNNSIYNNLCHILSYIIFSISPANTFGQLTQQTYVNHLVICLYQEFGIPSENTKNDPYSGERIYQIINFIQNNYTKKINLETISKEIGLHPQYFSTFFQKNFHCKFIDFLNLYRINQSMQELIHTDRNILDIALTNGFQNHKSYANSFEKYYKESPSSYRKKAQYRQQFPDTQFTNTYLSSLYSFYKQYEPEVKPYSEQIFSLKLNLRHCPSVHKRIHMQSICIGSGFYLLQDNVYNQLKRIARECSFTHVHFRNVFEDMLNVYTEPQPNQPLYYWESLDLIIERIIHLGFYPYIEIGYTPRELASSSLMLGFGNHPYTSVPTSLEKYGQLVHAFLTHNLKKYGINSMAHWKFDFWNTANLASANGFWDGTKEQFFDFYIKIWHIFKNVHKELVLGTPNFSLPDGMEWYEDFFKRCKKENITPDFLSIHLYSCMDNLDTFNGIFPYPSTTYNYLSLTNTEYLKNIIYFLKNLLKKFKLESLPIIAGEWNITYYLNDLTRDTSFMATYIAHSYIQIMGLIDGISFFCLSDDNDQTRPSRMIFAGNSGLISRQGIVKPSYYAFYLLHKLDHNIIYKKQPCIITKNKDRFHILIYNLSDYQKSKASNELEYISDKHRYQIFCNTQTLVFQGTFDVPHGNYFIKSYMLDQQHGSPYDTWLNMGAPEPLDDEVTTALLHTPYMDIHYTYQNNTEQIYLEEQIQVHGILLFEIRKI